MTLDQGTIAPQTIERAKFFLVNHGQLGPADLCRACVEELEIDPADVEAILHHARRELLDAAGYDLAEQLGTALTRLNDVYARAVRASDCRTALAAQREIDRLLSLQRANQEGTMKGPGVEKARQELADIMRHLAPLGLAAGGDPPAEHAKRAARLIRKLRAGRQ